jgi:hypothetical protein
MRLPLMSEFSRCAVFDSQAGGLATDVAVGARRVVANDSQARCTEAGSNEWAGNPIAPPLKAQRR